MNSIKIISMKGFNFINFITSEFLVLVEKYIHLIKLELKIYKKFWAILALGEILGYRVIPYIHILGQVQYFDVSPDAELNTGDCNIIAI